ncbi:MAG: hypothetical protein MMC23_001594 [Stictis urceolatum]|nr:hypothetical protein [Stictis urceolata]
MAHGVGDHCDVNSSMKNIHASKQDLSNHQYDDPTQWTRCEEFRAETPWESLPEGGGSKTQDLAGVNDFASGRVNMANYKAYNIWDESLVEMGGEQYHIGGGPALPWDGPAEEKLANFLRVALEDEPGKKESKEVTTSSMPGHKKALSASVKETWSPSDILIDALRFADVKHALPSWSSKKAIATTLAEDLFDQPAARSSNPEGNVSVAVLPSFTQYSPMANLQLLLAQYIRILHSKGVPFGLPSDPGWRQASSQVLDTVFDSEALVFLEQYRYSIDDVVGWAWILSVRSSEEAALKLLNLCNEKRTKSFQAVPSFVLLLLLRRDQITLPALRLLLSHALDRVLKTHNPKYESAPVISQEDSMDARNNAHGFKASYSEMQQLTFVLIFIRLTRHARKVWAAGLPGMAALFTHYFTIPAEGSLEASEQSYRSFTYNKIIQLLGLPSNRTPFLSIPHHQRAQFKLLRHMSQYDPPLMLNREGYRAVARVQFAHRKSLPEREWALMKSRSWPPWKQERSGLDEDVGVEFGASRGRETLYRLNEAGYATKEWEKEGMVLSGWDTDQTPTIQSRTFINRTVNNMEDDRIVRPIHHNAEPPLTESDNVWAARIRATRTVDEAWANFLDFKQKRGPVSGMVYFAMAAKLRYELYRHTGTSTVQNFASHRDGNGLQPLVPGDGLEVHVPPSNPRERIHVRTPVPHLQAFLENAVLDGLRFEGRFLAFLLEKARTFHDCSWYLENSALPPEAVAMFLGKKMTLDQYTLRCIPHTIFASYIRFLTRSRDHLPSAFRVENVFDDRFSSRNGKLNQLLHAFQLVLACKPEYHPPWNALISALSEEVTRIRSDALDRDFISQDITSWHAILELVQGMASSDVDIDWSDFRLICVAYAKAARACLELRKRFGLSTDVAFAALSDEGGSVHSSALKESESQHALQEKLMPNLSAKTARFLAKEENYYLRSSKYLRHLDQSERTLGDGVRILKKMFRRLVATGADGHNAPKLPSATRKVFDANQRAVNPREIMSRILETPHASHIHALVRALGHARDFEGLREVSHWMVSFASEINVVVAESRNGYSQIRKCLAAMRIFLEGDWVQGLLADRDDSLRRRFPVGQAPEELIQEVFESFEEVAEWGGWPSDDDVLKYLEPQPAPVRVTRGA